MRRIWFIALSNMLALSACNESATQPSNQTTIKVRSAEQDQLHKLDAFNLAIGLKTRGTPASASPMLGSSASIRTSTCGRRIASMTMARRATGQSSQVRMEARRSETAATFPEAAYPNA